MNDTNKQFGNERAAALVTASEIRPFGGLAEKFAFADKIYTIKHQPPLAKLRGLLSPRLVYPITSRA